MWVLSSLLLSLLLVICVWTPVWMQTPAGVWKRAAGNPFKVPPLKDRLAYPADLRHNGDRMPMVQDWYDASRARHLAPPQGLPQPRAGAIYPCFSLSALPPCHCAFPQSGPWQASNRHPLFFGGPAGRRQFSGAHPAGWLSGLSARVVKLVDAGDSKSPAARRVGSSPTPGTSLRKAAFRCVWRRPLVYLAGSAGRLPGLSFLPPFRLQLVLSLQPFGSTRGIWSSACDRMDRRVSSGLWAVIRSGAWPLDRRSRFRAVWTAASYNTRQT